MWVCISISYSVDLSKYHLIMVIVLGHRQCDTLTVRADLAQKHGQIHFERNFAVYIVVVVEFNVGLLVLIVDG